MADTQQLGVRIPADLYQQLRQHSERTGIPITRLVTDAVGALLQQRESHAA